MKRRIFFRCSCAFAMVVAFLVAGALRAAEEPSRLAVKTDQPNRPAVEKDDPIRQQVTAAELPRPRVNWYGMYFQTTKVGWVRDEVAKNRNGYVVTFQASMAVEATGQKIKMEASERREFDGAAPFALRAGRLEIKENGVARTVDLVRTKEGFAVTVTQGGEKHSPPLPEMDYTLTDALAEEIWFRKARAVGDSARFRSFSLDDLEMDVTTTTVTSRKESLVQGVPTVFYEATQSSEKKGNPLLARVDGRGTLLSMFIGPFEARMEPENVAKKIEKGGDLFVFGMAKLDQPIGDALKVERLVLAVDGAGAKSLTDAPNQTVLRDDKGAVTLELGVEFDKGEPATQKEMDEALAETVDLPTKSPEVVALARQAIGDAKTPREKTDRLVSFVSDYVKDELVGRSLTVKEILVQKQGDCTEHALLFAALARAAGIPARQVGGLMYMGDDVKAFGGHAWNEVAIDGKWVPVDATWGETVLDAAHITMEREGTRDNFFDMIGAVEFKLKDVRKVP